MKSETLELSQVGPAQSSPARPSRPEPTAVIGRRNSRLPDFREFWQYRDLLLFLVMRDVKARYAQSVLGAGWAVVQPLASMVIFTVIFGKLAKLDSDGVPYAIFSYSALVPWTYFAAALTGSTASLITQGSMLSKVYFPRLIIPVVPLFSKLIDFSIALLFVAALLIWFQITPSIWVLALPVLVLQMLLTAGAVGLWLAALAIQYRDVNHAMNFATQLLLYTVPVVYPLSYIPAEYRLIYALNPMVGIIEGFRAALLSTGPMPFELLGVGFVTTCVLLTTGIIFFRYKERFFADLV